MSGRLIDIENATLSWSKEDVELYEDDFAGGVLFALDKLTEEAPTIDAVEVVRCKDCKDHQHCELEQRLGWYGYCSEGERKE